MSIDVIIPAFNPGKHFEDCLSSTMNQTYKGPYEVFVIDDGSTENVYDIVKQVKGIEYIRLSKNKGAAYARNQGILSSFGEIIAFHDADDVMDPCRLSSVQAAFAKDPDLMLVTGNYRWLYNDCFLFDSHFSPEHCLARKFLFTDFSILTSATAIRRSALQTTGLFNENYEVCEDYDLWRRFLKFFPNQVKYIHEEWCQYRRNTDQGSLMQKYQKTARKSEILEKIFLEEEIDIPGYRSFLMQESQKKKEALAQLFL